MRSSLFIGSLAALALSIITALAGTGYAGPREEAVTSYNRGDYATALKHYHSLADGGDTSAQLSTGDMYAEGKGVPQDYAEAMKWYRKAADQGDADAQNSIGVMYRDGLGVPKDDVEANRWFRLAASRFPTWDAEDRDDAIKNRDAVAAEMMPEALSAASLIIILLVWGAMLAAPITLIVAIRRWQQVGRKRTPRKGGLLWIGAIVGGFVSAIMLLA